MKKNQVHTATKNVSKIRQLDDRLRPPSDLIEHFRQYAHEKPKVVALTCLGIGFALGWKLKLW